ncbi:hypothetical protein MVEN_00921400 [Mycena venus]|uniref:DUF6535 domain-containing protein n=1 Tax=Mycena venus TaxID=2733690 RepID=A0A8H6Y7W6_9AGAR|nr:hypothetical protein MVEN_00921400 [Mycena venus]
MSEVPEHLKEHEDAAASKLWAVYVSEAEKHDQALVESWRSNMDGLLIFAGLFSASLTAFIVESYQTLRPDSGDSTIQLLSQISQQLAAAANGSSFHISSPPVFTPSPTSLICNALWFTSLGLSLTCALMATLLEQWARDYLHRAHMRSAPVLRARMSSYLYYGLRRFGMHTVVNIVPLLLHASLFLFFAGLVAFLVPINVPIALVAGGLLALLTAVYSTLTLLPLWSMDCPYRTPISGAFWRIYLGFAALRRHYKKAADEATGSPAFQPDTVVDAISHRAMEMSPKRTDRDYRALVWTVKSLADEAKFEPFMAAIPDVLWGPHHRRHAYDDHIQRLLCNSDLQLESRMANLLRSCGSGLLDIETRKHREISCYKGLWAIASLQGSNGYREPMDFSEFGRKYINDLNDPSLGTLDPERLHYTTSVAAALKWTGYCAVRIHLAEQLQYLARCERDAQNGGSPDLRPVVSYLVSLLWSWPATFHWTVTSKLWRDHQQGQSTAIRHDYFPPTTLIPDLVREITDFCTNTPHYIIFGYYASLGCLNSPPYRWIETESMIRVNVPEPSSHLDAELERVLDRVIYTHLDGCKTSNEYYWIDSVVHSLCTVWRPDQISEPRPIPAAIIRYLNDRARDAAVTQLLTGYNFNLWSSVPKTLSDGPSIPTAGTVGIEDVLTALWRVLFLWPVHIEVSYVTEPPPFVEICESALAALSTMTPSSITFSVTVMLKALVISSLEPGTTNNAFFHWLLPTETTIIVPDDVSVEARALLLNTRIMEAKIALIAEYLDGSHVDFSPYRAAETLRSIFTIGGTHSYHRGTVHETHQLRLAHSMARFSEWPDAELLVALIETPIFDMYAHPEDAFSRSMRDCPWLDSSVARAQIKDVLAHVIESSPRQVWIRFNSRTINHRGAGLLSHRRA